MTFFIFNLSLNNREAFFDFKLNRTNVPQVFQFNQNVGPTITYKDPIDILLKFLDSDFFDFVVKKSNEFKKVSRNVTKRKSKKNFIIIDNNTNSTPTVNHSTIIPTVDQKNDQKKTKFLCCPVAQTYLKKLVFGVKSRK